MASAGHSATQRLQSIQVSGLITRKLGPSWKQSVGQTSTQSVYLQRMQFSVTTKVMAVSLTLGGSCRPASANGAGRGGSGRSVQFRDGPAGQFSYIRVRIIEGGHHVRPAIVVGDGAECADGGFAEVAHGILGALAQHRYGFDHAQRAQGIHGLFADLP